MTLHILPYIAVLALGMVAGGEASDRNPGTGSGIGGLLLAVVIFVALGALLGNY